MEPIYHKELQTLFLGDYLFFYLRCILHTGLQSISRESHFHFLKVVDNLNAHIIVMGDLHIAAADQLPPCLHLSIVVQELQRVTERIGGTPQQIVETSRGQAQ